MDREEIARHRLEELDQRQQMERGLGGVKTSVDRILRRPGRRLPTPLPRDIDKLDPRITRSYKELYLPAYDGAGTTVNGASGPTKEDWGNQEDAFVLKFNSQVNPQYAFWQLKMPENYSGGALILGSIRWAGNLDAGSTGIHWTLACRAFAVGDLMSVNLGTALEETVGVPTANNQFTVTKFSEDNRSLAPGNAASSAPGCDMQFVLGRASADAGDDYDDEAWVIGVSIFYPVFSFFEYAIGSNVT